LRARPWPAPASLTPQLRSCNQPLLSVLHGTGHRLEEIRLRRPPPDVDRDREGWFSRRSTPLPGQRHVLERDQLELRIPVREGELEAIESRARLHAVEDERAPARREHEVEIGRASCRERGDREG